jgi:hypothetical protein
VTGPIVPEHIRAAIHAGHVTLVVLFCDRCGLERRGDYIGVTTEDRLAAARAHAAEVAGWQIGQEDVCPVCAAGLRVCLADGHDELCDATCVPQPDGVSVHPEDVGSYRDLIVLALRVAPGTAQQKAGL